VALVTPAGRDDGWPSQAGDICDGSDEVYGNVACFRVWWDEGSEWAQSVPAGPLIVLVLERILTLASGDGERWAA
jgi:hypothetical protein